MPKENTVIREIEQGRAIFAYDKVNEAKEKFAENEKEGKKNQSKYKAYTKKIPMLIKNNGLGATFAFIKAKGEPSYQLIYEQVGQWLERYDGETFGKGKDLAGVLVSLPSPEYRAMTGEVLALFNWMRRYAEGLLEGDEVNGD
ncbi:type III-B CRISPR module-associated protein Cmr5 [Desulfoscipio geothermicus]|uniref:CRISPR type III-B/RAMP module-associated protein Cmr5 n=1 Tax=Desulfoscipio geothermicus DSM 3669 TaxID=1121426 RepID=A0A1I6EDR2_9FIRM|nr:type III-B CRISPR module-associated protein Cmr5 [Desulfoscipio geothermicus]SFR15899.1 CRISPR-associated protein Cmr5 [Desulfoscipio geothermicus DSM 3669]